MLTRRSAKFPGILAAEASWDGGSQLRINGAYSPLRAYAKFLESTRERSGNHCSHSGSSASATTKLRPRAIGRPFASTHDLAPGRFTFSDSSQLGTRRSRASSRNASVATATSFPCRNNLCIASAIHMDTVKLGVALRYLLVLFRWP